jgi:hypothetical protein
LTDSQIEVLEYGRLEPRPVLMISIDPRRHQAVPNENIVLLGRSKLSHILAALFEEVDHFVR